MALVHQSVAAKTARLQALNDLIGGGASLVVYEGSCPASPELAATATALVSLPCSPSAFGTVSATEPVTTTVDTTVNGAPATVTTTVPGNVALRANPIAPVVSLGNGVAGWARLNTADGHAVLDLDVGTAASGSDAQSTPAILMNATLLAGGIPVQVVSITLTEL